MKLLIYTIFLLSFSAFLIFICRKNIILMNSNGNKHQEFVGSFQTPLIGGIIVYFLPTQNKKSTNRPNILHSQNMASADILRPRRLFQRS